LILLCASQISLSFIDFLKINFVANRKRAALSEIFHGYPIN
jgi:hypothetical protein